MYDFAHPIQDALEGITHSLCSLEYEDHRPLYNWVIEHTSVPSTPRQIEFARLNITNTVLSKRYLRSLVEGGIVDGWDDPRMPTLCGLRRRGYTPASILDFIDRIGVSKANSMVNIGLLEHCVREELNAKAPRRIAVLNPIKVIVDNYPEDRTEYFPVPNNPNDPDAGTRDVPFTRELWIDADDFAEVPPPKFFRLKPGGEVRLMSSYIIQCGEIVKNEDGTIAEIHVTADLETGTGVPTDRKVKGTIHWLSAKYAASTTVILYDRLFTEENMNDLPEGKTYADYLNTESAVRMENAKIEPSLAEAEPGEKFQFVRIGYFAKDTKNADTFNRIVSLKDSYKPE
jgi:glutaminyl-tRNA synthetase